jgi:hypothetical protein
VNIAPSPNNAKKQGIRVTRKEYPVGVAGVKLSLEEIARRIREGRADPAVRGWAGDVLIKAGRPQSDTARMGAILSAIRKVTVFVPDPVGTEMNVSAAGTLCLRPNLCVRAADCFPAGTLLLRSDFEFVPIEKIKAGDKIWGLDKWSTVTKVAFKGKLSVDAITMNNGSTMHLTPDHKVYAGRCKHGKGSECLTCIAGSMRVESFTRVHVSDLREGETLQQPERVEFGVGESDPDRAYVEGLALADGWVSHANDFQIAGRDGMRKEAQKKEVEAICKRLGIETHWHKRYITVKDRDWTERIAGLGHYARQKHLETLNLSETTAEAYLRGLMADSTANTSGGGRTYSTTSRQLFLQVRLLHRMFGRSCGLKFMTPEQHGGAGKHPLWRLGVRDTKAQKAEKVLAVKSIERNVRKTQCWDISTDDHYVYLPEHDVTVSNCDDLVIVTGSALMSVGIPVIVVKQTFGEGDQEHVMIKAQDTQTGQWLRIDPSTDHPVGQSLTASHEFEMDPMQPSMIGLRGVPDAEYVGIGAPSASIVRVRPRFLGAPPSGAAIPSSVVIDGPYNQASTDLQNQMVLPMQAADLHYGAGDYSAAITSYQAAGMAGATANGPEIDLVGAANTTQSYTQQAWNLNTELQQLADNGDQASADAARNYALQMLALYLTAMNSGTATLTAGGVPSASSLSLFQAALLALGGGAAAALLYEYWLSQGGKPLPLPALPAPIKKLLRV